ncbi:NAD(P)/FAD-dependent oxidoreductase [Actinomadura rubrisoli]|uniref:Hydroxylase n=1 Tax=Actinomadura rubrisoli TaxID=2530368 RepID=A0A4R5CB91_9ACTN|nr:hydroxylase [Actinomadura rubrisoli]TDD94342.1 hydroxylase [Actinomadura rubrisoli]
MTVKTGGHAIVIGGGLAGLLSAHVLTSHFDEVTVIERDQPDDGPHSTSPQRDHLHLLWGRGSATIDRLVPGFGRHLTDHGAVHLSLPRDVGWLGPAGWLRPVAAARAVTCGKALIDTAVRHHMATVGRLCPATVTGLIIQRRRVTGVRYLLPADPTPHSLPADLVIDASGRASRTPHWLRSEGLPPPRENVLNAGFSYSSRRYKLPPGLLAERKGLFLPPDAHGVRRGGALYRQEEGQVICTMAGIGDDAPGTDPESFLDFARDLRSPAIHQVIRDAEPLNPVATFRRTVNRRREFGDPARTPEGLIAVGDAACTLNPLYGHGMSVAAFQAAALHRHLTSQGPHLDTARLQRALDACANSAWAIAAGEDRQYLAAALTSPRTWLTHHFVRTIAAASTRQSAACQSLISVIALDRPPLALTRASAALITGTRALHQQHH